MKNGPRTLSLADATGQDSNSAANKWIGECAISTDKTYPVASGHTLMLSDMVQLNDLVFCVGLHTLITPKGVSVWRQPWCRHPQRDRAEPWYPFHELQERKISDITITEAVPQYWSPRQKLWLPADKAPPEFHPVGPLLEQCLLQSHRQEVQAQEPEL